MIKIILSIVSVSIVTALVVGTLFLNSILGAFGMVATSAENLNRLAASQHVVDKMKQNHKSRKARATRRFAKRTGKRVASSAIAAATIGTVAVVAVVAGLEVVDYCDEKEALNDEGNILYRENKAFDYESCMDETMEDSKQIITASINDSSVAVKIAWENTQQYSTEKWDQLTLSISDIIDSITD